MAEIPPHRYQLRPQLWLFTRRFLAQEAYGGIALFSAAVIAMLWANSPWSDSYFNLWHTSVGFEIGNLIFNMDLGHWVNDVFMALFFFVIGMEIKREITVGELSTMKQAAFPVIAAMGGMIVPVLIYFSFNMQPGGEIRGFGIPMATDIAFALGFILLVGKRAPLSLKIFLVSLAVIDDLGAIIIIALFYGESLQFVFLGYTAIVLLALFLLNRLGIKKLWPYLILGIALWFFVHQSGIHAVIAGILLAMTIPVRSKISSEQFMQICKCEIDIFNKKDKEREGILLNDEQVDSLEMLGSSYEAVQSPLARLEKAWHPISSFIVMPIFALANAGIHISGLSSPFITPVTLGIVLGLMLGKPIGITGATYLAHRLGWAKKPNAISWKHVFGAGILGGVGFTMSIFVTQLSFTDPALTSMAKLFILCSSLIMGIFGVLYLMRTGTSGKH
jgi:NhaA family Na+:H+ antiporter